MAEEIGFSGRTRIRAGLEQPQDLEALLPMRASAPPDFASGAAMAAEDGSAD